MELNAAAVGQAFAQLSGEQPAEEGTQRQALCARLCAQCARQVGAAVPPGLSQEELSPWQPPLEDLAAAMAFYQLLLAEEALAPQSLSAGGVKITAGGGSGKALGLVAEKRRAVSPLLGEPGFCFCAVGEVPHEA